MPDAVEKFLVPFAQSEPALSALLAACLHDSIQWQDERHLELLRAIEKAPGGREKAGETIDRLREASDLEVVTEAWMANMLSPAPT